MFVFSSAAPGIQKHPECSASNLLRLSALHVQCPHVLPHGSQALCEKVSVKFFFSPSGLEIVRSELTCPESTKIS